MIFALSTVTLAVLSFGRIMATPLPQVTQNPQDPDANLPPLNTTTYMGCFSSSGPLVDQGAYTYQAMGWCQPLCVRQSKPVIGFSNGTNCWCGDEMPAASDKVADSECSVDCVGYPQDTCKSLGPSRKPSRVNVMLIWTTGGGSNAFAVWNDGVQPKVYNADSSPSSTAAPSNAPSTTNAGSPTLVQVASTVYVTAPGSTSALIVYTTQTATPPSSGPNKAAIAAGVIVAIVVVCAIIGGIMFWLRQKRRRELAQEHRRKEKPQSPSTASLPDSRLEPSVMFQRRQSDCSIMDNHDYSRRILKVIPDAVDLDHQC